MTQAYAYHNLTQAHFSVEVVSESELASGRAAQYAAVILYDVKYIPRSVYDALVKYAAAGGVVLLDQNVPFTVPGAQRLPLDIGSGGPAARSPGPVDYGHTERIEAVKKAVGAYVRPQFDSSDVRVVASTFTSDSVAYTWFVNTEDATEYMFGRERVMPGVAGAGTPEKLKQVVDWETSEIARGPYVAELSYDDVPGVPYDLVHGGEVSLRVPDPKSAHRILRLMTDRFGGTLVAWLPSRITSLRVDAPSGAAPGSPVRFQSTTLCGERAAPGALPVEFELRDPYGASSPLSGVRLAENGSAVFEWTPAVNDSIGDWHLRVTDLASGFSVRKTVRLGAP